MSPEDNQASTDEFIKLFTGLDKESDRALAIVVAAYIEHLLEKIIVKHFQISMTKAKKLFEGPSAFMGTFSSKIVFCDLTGLELSASRKKTPHRASR